MQESDCCSVPKEQFEGKNAFGDNTNKMLHILEMNSTKVVALIVNGQAQSQMDLGGWYVPILLMYYQTTPFIEENRDTLGQKKKYYCLCAVHSERVV